MFTTPRLVAVALCAALNFAIGNIVYLVKLPIYLDSIGTILCALLIFQTPELPEPLDLLSPWLDMQTRRVESMISDLEAQTHRRFIKTHTPLDGLELHDG